MGKRTVLLVASLAAVSAGCQEAFDPYHRLNELRVMAVQAEPASPALNQTATLRALIHALPTQAIGSYTWSWCPFPGPSTSGYPCIPREELIAMTGGALDIPPYELPAGETSSFTNVFPPEVLAQICAGAGGTGFLADCDFGFPIQIKLTVETTADSAPPDLIDVVWTMRLPIDPAAPPNVNPVLDPGASIVARINGEPQPIDDLDNPVVTLPRDVGTIVRVDTLTETASEAYQAFDDDGQPFEDRERLTLSWFVESGDIDEERTAFIAGVEPIEDTRRNAWVPALREDYDRDTARIYVVIRDNRGGVTWVQGRVRLEDGP